MPFDAIVVGSGFGGSVCAARLAERGLRVLILERGPWWGPQQKDRPPEDRRDLPRGPFGIRKLVRNLRVARKGRRYERVFFVDGLLEAHRFDHLQAFTASGVGGGSHVYANVLEEPAPDFFEGFPREITFAEMHPYFEKVRAMLRPVQHPAPLQRFEAFRQAVEGAGLPAVEFPRLAAVWGDPAHPRQVTNAAGVTQSTSTEHGDAFMGCTDGSKTTLDLTYVPVALRHQAEVRPLCEVTAVAAEGGGYAVRYRDHRTGQERSEAAPRLVLAAGGLNTQRLLFAARDGHGGLPRLPATLGRNFSTNADYASLLWKTSKVMDTSRGPSLGALSRIARDGVHRLLIGEVGLPLSAIPLPRPLLRGLRRSTLLFCMGRDAASATLAFDGKGLTTSIGRSLDPDLFAEIDDVTTRVAGHYGLGRLLLNVVAGRDPEGLFTVHPLGGCAIGRGPEDGFTDHRGQVFGHPGLFVADGSLYPRAPGIPPSLTIAALAERQAALMD